MNAKQFVLIAIATMLTITVTAQAPQGINYQTVVRDDTGQLLANQNVSMRFSILQGSATGSSVYSERHVITTTPLGLANVVVGKGNALSGTFSSINWSSGVYFIKIDLDPAGGTSYADMGTQQLMSVPYALYAEGFPGYVAGAGIQISGKTVTNTAPDQTVSLVGTGGTSVSGTYPGPFTISSPRIVAGTSSGGFAPTIITGSGFTATRTSDGVYNVSFSTAFSSAPTVTATVYNSNSTYLSTTELVKVKGVSTTGFTIYTFSGSGSLTGVNTIPFSFTAIGN